MTGGTLFVVATPIGHRDDLSPRARAVLADVAVVASEDTRHTGRLLSHFGITARLVALHEHNEEAMSAELVARLREGDSVALVSDAGTPLVSDPGYRLLAAAHAAGVTVSPVPGPSAVLAALSVAGLPTDRFTFEGFLPPRQAARRKRLAALAGETRTLVFYEAVHRVAEVLVDLADAFGGERPAFLGRELTKLHEQCLSGTLEELVEGMASGDIPARGEFVLVVQGAAAAVAPEDADVDRLLATLLRHLGERDAVAVACELSGARRNAVYRRMLALKGTDADS